MNSAAETSARQSRAGAPVSRAWIAVGAAVMAAVFLMVPDAVHALPDPNPEQPPGTEGFTTVLNWIAWGVIVLGLAGFLCSAGFLAFASFTGREINGFKGLVIAIIVCILATAAGTIMAVFV